MHKKWIIAFLVLSLCFIQMPISYAKANQNKTDFANVVLFVCFEDDGGDAYFHDSTKVEGIMNDYNGSHGRSLTNYLSTISYGQFSIHNIFPQYDESQKIINAYELPNTLREEAQKENVDAKIIDEIILKQPQLQSQMIDYNQDGVVDNLTIVLYGKSEMSESEKIPTYHPHMSTYQGSQKLFDKSIRTYNMLNTYSIEHSHSGVLAHEFLHALGFGDLYDSKNGRLPVSTWDIMSSNNKYMPYPLAYTRMKTMNWIDIETITSSQTLTLSSQDQADGAQAYILKSPFRSDEQFVIEMRKSNDMNDNNALDGIIGGSGIIVYRVKAEKEQLSNYNGEEDVYIFRPQKGQNGYDDNESLAILNAYLSKESQRTSIGTSDMNQTLEDGALAFSDGTNSGIVISQVSSSAGNQMTCQVTIPRSEDYDIWEDTLFEDTTGSVSKIISMKEDNKKLYLVTAIADGYPSSTLQMHIYDGTHWVNEEKVINEKSIISDAQIEFINGKLYLGYIAQSTFKLYCFENHTWTLITTKNDMAYGFDMTVLNNQLYMSYIMNDQAKLARLDQNTFTDLGIYYKGISGQPKIIQMNNTLYTAVRRVTGQNDTIEVYKYENNQFTHITQNSIEGSAYDIEALHQKLFVVTGGYNTSLQINTYDGTKWTLGKQQNIKLSEPKLTTTQGNLYVLASSLNEHYTRVYEYDVENDQYILEGNNIDLGSTSLNLASFDNQLYVSYVKESNQQITVKNKSITNELLSIYAVPPKKVIYEQGEQVQLDGLSVKAIYQKGERQLTSQDYTISQLNTETIGKHTAVITFQGKQTTFSYEVKARSSIPITAVILSQKKVTMNEKTSLKLSATITPSNTTENKTLTWISSNPTIATVSNGVIYAKSPGTVTITVKTSNQKTDTCQVTVKKVYLPGDVNGDDKVTSLDYIQIKNHIMKTKILTGDALKRADVNKDGKVTSLDYIKIKNHIMGTNRLF